MNRFQHAFGRLADQNRKALVAYFTAGDPDFDTSLAIITAACAAGVDVLEIGVPFSDATNDGPVIQAAARRALDAGMSLRRVLDLASKLRAAHPKTPLVLFSYYNPLLAFGADRIGPALEAAGIDGLLIVDLPPEESAELTGRFGGRDLPLIRLVAPTTPPERMKAIATGAGGFLYLITRTGVTGSGTLDRTAVAGQAAALKALSALPVCLGFGISTPEDARDLGPLADGIVIGSAFVTLAHAAGRDAPAAVGARVSEIRTALDQNVAFHAR
jgi:tryptophan synthase alpha chain